MLDCLNRFEGSDLFPGTRFPFREPDPRVGHIRRVAEMKFKVAVNGMTGQIHGYTSMSAFAGRIAEMWKDEFFQHLKQSTLGEPYFEKAIAFKQQYLPERIYKYRGDTSNARKNLASSTIWLASPESYNDPYDCFLQFSATSMASAFERGLIDAFATGYKLEVPLEKINEAKQSLTPLQTFIQTIGSEGKAGSSPQHVAKILAEVVPNYIKTTVEFLQLVRTIAKICSFSAVHDSILMWIHYAKDHQGFCIEYDLKKFGPGDPFLRNLYPVTYSHDLVDLTSWAEKLVTGKAEDLTPGFLLLGVLQKFEGWEYEQEWRYVFFQEEPTSKRDRPMPQPSRVFLGSKATPATTKELCSICEGKNIPVWQMRMSSEKYELLADPI